LIDVDAFLIILSTTLTVMVVAFVITSMGLDVVTLLLSKIWGLAVLGLHNTFRNASSAVDCRIQALGISIIDIPVLAAGVLALAIMAVDVTGLAQSRLRPHEIWRGGTECWIG
jgi:hypothetical protein